MSTETCRECGRDLLFSARQRGNGLCGPCTRKKALFERWDTVLRLMEDD